MQKNENRCFQFSFFLKNTIEVYIFKPILLILQDLLIFNCLDKFLPYAHLDDPNIFTFFIVVQVELSPFSPHHSPYPSHPHFPPLILTPFGFVHVSFIHVPWWPFPLFPPLSHLTSAPVTVSLFLISVSLVIFC